MLKKFKRMLKGSATSKSPITVRDFKIRILDLEAELGRSRELVRSRDLKLAEAEKTIKRLQLGNEELRRNIDALRGKDGISSNEVHRSFFDIKDKLEDYEVFKK